LALTALIHKYCAVCHTDAARNGGLSLEHYDAAKPDAALAAMLLSKLRSGAMGAAGLGVPDKETQAAQAKSWTVIRTEERTIASIVRDVPPRKTEPDAPVYRLILACDTENQVGNIHLTWSLVAQTNRIFEVSSDGGPATPYEQIRRLIEFAHAQRRLPLP
jgi:hypothetical protein